MPSVKHKRQGNAKLAAPAKAETADLATILSGQTPTEESFGRDYQRLLVALQTSPPGALLFIQVNSPVRRRQLPEQLKVDGLQRSFAIADFSTFQPGPPPYGVLREFLESLKPASPEILFVDGLEYWIDAHPKPGGVLEELNLGRERLANLGVVVVFLLPVYLIDLIRAHALNLWSWRAHHYVLASDEGEERQHSTSYFLSTGHIIAPGDTPEARARRIRILKRLLQEGLAEHRTPEALLRPILLPLANELHDNGRFTEALQILALLGNSLEAIKDARQKAEILTLRGISLVALGDLANAEPLLRQALLIQEQILPPEHIEFVESLNNLAILYAQQGKGGEAELLFQRALAIAEQIQGPMRPYVAATLNNLADFYQGQGKYAEVEPLLQRALAIAEHDLGPTHPNVAASLNNLAGLYHNQGNYAGAEPLLQRALAILEKSFGQDHPYFILVLQNYSILLRTVKRDAEAEPLEARARELGEKRRQRSTEEVG